MIPQYLVFFKAFAPLILWFGKKYLIKNPPCEKYSVWSAQDTFILTVDISQYLNEEQERVALSATLIYKA